MALKIETLFTFPFFSYVKPKFSEMIHLSIFLCENLSQTNIFPTHLTGSGKQTGTVECTCSGVFGRVPYQGWGQPPSGEVPQLSHHPFSHQTTASWQLSGGNKIFIYTIFFIYCKLDKFFILDYSLTGYGPTYRNVKTSSFNLIIVLLGMVQHIETLKQVL